MLKLIPLSNRILCEPIIETEKSGVFRSGSEKDDKKLRPEKGKVIAVGKEYQGELKKGDVCYYEKYQVAWLTVGKQEYVCGLPDDFFVIEISK